MVALDPLARDDVNDVDDNDAPALFSIKLELVLECDSPMNALGNY
jgi:hypothetical protein